MKLPISDIVKGHVNEALGLNKDFAQARQEICKQCPIYSSRMGGLCNDKLWLDPETGDVSLKHKDGYVRGCGCRIPAKTTLPNAKCVAGKW